MKMFINLSISLIVISVLFDLIRAETCTKIDSCSCKIESTNFVLNLRPLSNPKNPSLQAPDKDGSYKYVYNPCDPLPDCAGQMNVSVCQESKTKKYCAGKETSVKFEGDLQSNALNLITECDTDIKRKTHINIVCDSDRLGSLEFVSENTSTADYFLKLRTLHACIKPSSTSGLSTGSVLLLIFFLLLIVYFIAGILFMKFARRASGVEIVPNLEFWKGLPSLIKDGFVFVSKRCRKDTAYSQI